MESKREAPKVQLVRPAREHLPGYIEALRKDWSPDNMRGIAATKDQLEAIEKDADGFLARAIDREAKGPPLKLPDGSTVPRLPGIVLWIWDGEFCGTINFRWQAGTPELPPHVLGHIGYAVVPWKRGRGYATRALGLLMEHVRTEGLEYVEITTDPDNVASQKVITANGGIFVGKYTRPPQYGSTQGLRFRIYARVGNVNE
jgi:predicted acetyltransferase